MPKPLQLSIVATFTADPLRHSLAFWLDRSRVESRTHFAPYGQVLQELVNRESAWHQTRNGVNVLLLRLEDLFRDTPEETDPSRAEAFCAEFEARLTAAMPYSRVPSIVVFCPSGVATSAAQARARRIGELEQAVASRLEALAGVTTILSGEALEMYPTAQTYDAAGDHHAHIPYTLEYFAVLGTLIVRRLAALRRPPIKVIAIDCDDTLWKGVVGELGAHEVDIDLASRAFQELLVAQCRAGRLVALCSKNNPDDVWEVFDGRTEMVLQREHVAAARINWQPKSANIRELGKELGLGLDTFLFFDDSPMECEEVRANCAEVTAITMPRDRNRTASFLKHVWELDVLKITNEDRERTKQYKTKVAREHFRRTVSDHLAFLRALEVEVAVVPVETDDIERASRLTQKTNQFNLSGRRRTEADIAALLRSGRHSCVLARTKDRFGDYGIVGLIVLEERDGDLVVDSFLLSCRVLGRGVEHHLLSFVAKTARTRNIQTVRLPFVESKRNRPIQEFLDRLVVERLARPGEGGTQYVVRSDSIADGWQLVERLVDETTTLGADGEERTSEEESGDRRPSAEDRLPEWRELSRVALQLRSAAEIAAAVANHDIEARVTAPAKKWVGLEAWLAEIWCGALRVSAVGPEDDFSDLGGDSLEAAQVTIRVQERLKSVLHVTMLLEAGTIKNFADQLRKDYPVEIARAFPESEDLARNPATELEGVTEAQIVAFRGNLIHAQLAPPGEPRKKNRRAIFILSAPRTGSTLLRVMLAGHSRLFSPPELELLGFNTMRERAQVLSGTNSFAAEGILRAWMELKHCGLAEAKAFVDECSATEMSIADFFALVQEACQPRILVDKSINYALDRAILEGMESLFENAFYIHLTRHPIGMMQSFDAIHLEQILWRATEIRKERGFSRFNLAELTWLTCTENITQFLARVPATRSCIIKFEELVRSPEAAMRELCARLGTAFEMGMLKPHEEGRMTDGLHETSRMAGDPTFGSKTTIDERRGHAWRASPLAGYDLNERVRDIGRQMGYTDL